MLLFVRPIHKTFIACRTSGLRQRPSCKFKQPTVSAQSPIHTLGTTFMLLFIRTMRTSSSTRSRTACSLAWAVVQGNATPGTSATLVAVLLLLGRGRSVTSSSRAKSSSFTPRPTDTPATARCDYDPVLTCPTCAPAKTHRGVHTAGHGGARHRPHYGETRHRPLPSRCGERG
jgi:hypothetical protein